jgi:hypothetical protein
MLRVCVAVGLCLAIALLASPGGAAPDPSCVDGESTYTTDTLHDLRSFSDAMAIVQAVKETLPPEPGGPEGWAGLIGRRVTFRVERVLWRRPHAPRPPATARFNDLGWWGEPDDRVPMYVCGETRMELGRRYLAPIVRHNGAWYPVFTARLLVEGDRVVGGVDGGEPTHAHHALIGRRVGAAVRLLGRTKPYRAVVRDPSGSPARRWQRVDRDDYRVWRVPFPNLVVASGVTEKSRWQMYARRARRGLCFGIEARALWRGGPGPSGETCGPRDLPSTRPSLGVFTDPGRGVFAFGGAGTRVWAMRVRFGGSEWQRAETVPSPTQLHIKQRFWVATSDGQCPLVSVQALGRGGRVLWDHRTPPLSVRPGEPDPYAAC